jgi:hypothetical protein
VVEVSLDALFSGLGVDDEYTTQPTPALVDHRELVSVVLVFFGVIVVNDGEAVAVSARRAGDELLLVVRVT